MRAALANCSQCELISRKRCNGQSVALEFAPLPNYYAPYYNISCAMRTSENIHAGEGTERLPHPDRSWNADGPVFPQLLDPGAARLGIGRTGLSARANPAFVRKTDRVPRHGRSARLDRGILRPSPRLAVVRTQR